MSFPRQACDHGLLCVCFRASLSCVGALAALCYVYRAWGMLCAQATLCATFTVPEACSVLKLRSVLRLQSLRRERLCPTQACPPLLMLSPPKP